MLFLAALCAIVLVSCVIFLLDSMFGGQDFPSNSAIALQTIGVLKDRHLEDSRFYDLGSARGGFALKIAKAFPDMQVMGIDGSWVRNLIAKAKSVFYKNLSFKKQDIFLSDVSSADVVYIYLPQELMPQLETKLKKELKSGAIVISNKVNFPNWQAVQQLDKIFVYVKE